MKLFKSLGEFSYHPLDKKSLARGISALAFSVATSIGVIALNERNYWQVTIYRTQSVDFNILANLLPYKLSNLLVKGEHQKIQKLVDTNYGLFAIVVTDCQSAKDTDCQGQKILYGSKIRIESTPNGRQRLISQDDYTSTWLKKFENTNSPAKLLNGELSVVLRDPPPLDPDWNFASPRATEVSRLKSSEQGKVIGRAYFIRGNPPSFGAGIEKWLKNPVASSSTNSVYNAIAGTGMFTAFIVWLLSEIVSFKSIKADRYRLQGEIAQREAAESRLQSEIAQREATESRLQSEIAQQEAAESRLQSEIAQNRCEELSQQVHYLTQETQRAETVASQSQTQVESLRKAFQSAEFTASQDRQRIAELAQTLDATTTEKQRAETVASQSQTQVESLRQALQSAESTASKDRERISELAQTLDATQKAEVQAKEHVNYLFDSIDEDRDNIRAENERLEEENRHLTSENARLERGDNRATSAEEIEIEAHSDISNVIDALRKAQEHFPILEIWGNAYREAETRLNYQPVSVYNALLRLAKVGYLYFNDELNGECFLIRLRQEGIRCSEESDSTMRDPRLSSLRTFNNGDGVSIRMSKHLKIGEEVRIHFELDREERKIRIGYCGRHLPTSRNR